jgi:adenylate cyclase
MNDVELRDTVRRIQDIIYSETGARLGVNAEEAVAKILGNVASHNLSGAEGFSSRDITILLADLRGFTSLSATYPATTVLKLLNRCLITMSEVVFKHQGTIDKFMGDSIMVLFGGAVSPEDDVRRAVLCAVDLQIAMDELNEHYKTLGLPELYLGIGINTGPVMTGTLGSNLYAAYTVIGDEVNLASRIEAFSLRGQVLISQSTFERCGDLAETGEPMEVHVKGKTNPVTLREVLAIPSLGKIVPRREIRRSPRVTAKMPFSYQVIENDVALPQSHHGMILDIGYHGILAEMDQQLAPLSEIKLNFDLVLIGSRATDIYAKILKTEKSDQGSLSGLEFTSLSAQNSRDIQLLVQLLIQGCESK